MRTGQHLAVGVQQRDGVARQHFGRCAIAQQAVGGVFGHYHTAKFALYVQRYLQLQQRRSVVRTRYRLGIDRLLQVTR